MRIAAIICEYNPFHNGHKFHIEETKKQTGADAVVAVMSGNFVQRGDAAVFGKEYRTRLAIAGGADLVLELPTVYSSGSAEFFAKGAMEILNALGCVDFLSFGAETPDKNALLEIAKCLFSEPLEFSELLKRYCDDGVSFPAARAKAVCDYLGDTAGEILSEPNNILGIEYCKALLKIKSNINILPIKRTGANHDSDEICGEIASATLIRDLFMQRKADTAFSYMPDFSKEILKNAPLHSLKELEKVILCELIKMPEDMLGKISDVSEGLENRIKTAVLSASNLDELINSVKTKRYTHSRIRRIILSAFLGISDCDRHSKPCYIKILGHSEVGQKVIAMAKKTSSLPIVRNTSQVNKLKNPDIKAAWERERIFDRLYEMSKITEE